LQSPDNPADFLLTETLAGGSAIITTELEGRAIAEPRRKIVPHARTGLNKDATPSARIASLDGLRAISIIMVLVGHSAGAVGHRPAVLDFLCHMFGDGELGVAVFFVISGYLITSLLVREQQRAGQIHLGNFYLRRIFRIWPAFYLYLLTIAVLASLGGIRVSRSAFLAAATFTWNYHVGNWNWFLGHLWSLSIEEQFYLAWPMVLYIGGKSLARKVAVLIIGLSPLLRIATYTFFPRLRDYIPYMLHTRADILMFGCLAALLSGNLIFERLLDGIFRLKLPLIAVAFLLLISPNLYDRFGANYMIPIGFTLDGAAITLFMLWVVRRPNSIVGRVLNLGPICFLGVISYSLYIWQQLFLTGFNVSFLGGFPMNYLAAFAAAVISYFAVERPFLSLRAKLRFKAISARSFG
jgi:peptidoglycan/LPS O-acetylase OafA/YrhL